MNSKHIYIISIIILIIISCRPKLNELVIDKNQYRDQLEGFWLGQSIANWTGLITEGDKIGTPVDGKGGGFYTRENWGGPGASGNIGQTLAERNLSRITALVALMFAATTLSLFWFLD